MIGYLPAAAAVVLMLTAAGCSFNNPPAADEDAVSYYSKEIALSSWIDPDQTVADVVETRIYGENGKLAAVSKNTWEEMDEPGYYMITRTDVYEADTDGSQNFVEYYLYDYFKDAYQYLDDDGNTVDAVDYLLLRGRSYSADDDVLRLYYYVVYDTDDDPIPDDGIGNDTDSINFAYYESIIDKRTSDSATTAAQYATYLTDIDGGKSFRTEKYYVRNQDDTGLELSQEFASWYDTDGDYYYDYLYDLYHSFKGEDAADEFYYFTRYSRDDNGYIYEQADYIYDALGATLPSTTVPVLADGSFDDAPFNYDIQFDRIGEKATVLLTDYDESGNIILDQRWYKGDLIEYTSYTYNEYSELTDQVRYTGGGSLLRDRTTIRFRDEVLYGEQYSVSETCEYKYYDLDDAESQADESSKGLSRINRPADSYSGLSESQLKHLQYSRLNNTYRK